MAGSYFLRFKKCISRRIARFNLPCNACRILQKLHGYFVFFPLDTNYVIMKKAPFALLAILPGLLFAQIQSPSDFLGYELGSKFTRHHRVVDYFEHVASSENVELQPYGRTYEDRPLMLAFVSTKENLSKLEQIREDNLRRAGILEGAPSTHVNITWLSYNVHGNEASSTEAAMATIYELIKEGSDKRTWLENTFVIIDPCLNPDGRDRYVNFYWKYGAQPFNPNPEALEHNEDWPGGRPNHYLFDLNRDWAWQTQVETQSRLKVYNQWLPQIHVDFHEQGYNSPYYFAPAAQPFHELITPFQRDFQYEIGKNHARYFDENNWFYFTRQVFDLLYPSYGDTYPVYNGAIGMTYEQAGHGRAGLGVIKQEGDTLTLKDRVAHHYTTGLSTIEVASKNNDRLLSEFGSFFGDHDALKYKTFVLKSDENDDKFSQLKLWLDAQGIRYGKAASAKGVKGYDYQSGKSATFSIDAEDLVVSTKQPKATLVHVLFEPKTELVDSVTYDITAWGVPYAYGIKAYATKQVVSVKMLDSKGAFQPAPVPEKAYAFVSKWNSMQDARFLAELLKAGVKVRFTEKPIVYQGNTFERGSIIIAKRDNASIEAFESFIVKLANDNERVLSVLETGFMDKGPDIGSGDVKYLKKPNIALLGHEGTSSLAFGATWHFMEQELNYPVTVIATDYFGRVELDQYDVLIMQDGWYGSFGDSEKQKIMDWVSKGGKLVAIDGALSKWKNSDFTGLVSVLDTENSDFDTKKKDRNEEARLVPYADQERHFIKSFAPGAVYKVQLDATHPLAFGYDQTYFSLKNSADRVAYLSGGNVGVIESAGDLVSGFAGSYVREDMENTLVFGVEQKGSGHIVYMVDNPLFRSFWQNGKLLFVNALFMVGQ